MADMMESEADIVADCPHTESTRVCTDQICFRCGGNAVVTKRNISTSSYPPFYYSSSPNHVIFLTYCILIGAPYIGCKNIALYGISLV